MGCALTGFVEITSTGWPLPDVLGSTDHNSVKTLQPRAKGVDCEDKFTEQE